MDKIWQMYILRCGDGTLYTGITTDIPRRLKMHREGRGAKYTRGRGPLTLAYCESCGSRSQALRREWQVKQLPRQKKEQLIASRENLLSGSHAADTCPAFGGYDEKEKRIL